MIEENEVAQVLPSPPSMTKIAFATATGLIVAGVLLVVAVLPAEYGIDPLGTGKALGLTDLANAGKVAVPPAIAEATIAPVLGESAASSKWGAPGPRMMGAFLPQSKRYMLDSREIKLEPHEGMEIKYNMKKGAGLIYSWTAEKPLLYEFHGQPDVRPPDSGRDYFESYELDDKAGKDQQHGTFVAPSTGIHGWFWENTSSEPVTLKLVSAGFYNWIQESRHDKQTTLDPMEPK